MVDDATFRVGADTSLKLPVGGDAKYIGVSRDGLSEQREALQNDRGRAAQAGGQMLDTVSRERESGEALKVRVAARTASLNQIALTGAFGLEQLLKIAARWIGANPDDVSVLPNLDFVDDALAGEELVKLMTAKSLGAPISQESIHALMQEHGLTEKTYQDEIAAIQAEADLVGSSEEPPGDGDGNGGIGDGQTTEET